MTRKTSGWDKFLAWFATSPFGTALRVGVGAGLAWILDNIGLFQLSPTVQVGVVAAVSAALRWFNPQDPAYGLKPQA